MHSCIATSGFPPWQGQWNFNSGAQMQRSIRLHRHAQEVYRFTVSHHVHLWKGNLVSIAEESTKYDFKMAQPTKSSS